MESSEFYSELKAKGLLLANHDGKLLVGPKEKLTKEDRKLLKVLKDELLALPAMMKVHPESVHGVRSEPNFKVFYRKDILMPSICLFLRLKVKTTYTTYTKYTRQRTLNSVSLDHGFFQTIKPGSKMVETIRNMMLDLTNLLCECKTWFVI